MVNFFYLHENPRICAKYYCDKHILKIPIEIAQILCNVHREYSKNKSNEILYKKCNMIRDNSIPYRWVKKSIENYKYACNLAIELINEYKFRFNKKSHKTEILLKWLQDNYPDLPKIAKTPFEVAHKYEMFKYISENPLISSRYLYAEIKCLKDKWTNRNIPKWLTKLRDKVRINKCELKYKLIKLTNIILPKIYSKSNILYKNLKKNDYIQIIGDTLFGYKWEIMIKKMVTYKLLKKENTQIFDILTYPQLYYCLEIGNKMKKQNMLEKYYILSLKYRKNLDFPKKDINYREKEFYYIYKKELREELLNKICPYSDEIIVYFNISNLGYAKESIKGLNELLSSYIKEKDFIGIDVILKYFLIGTKSKNNNIKKLFDKEYNKYICAKCINQYRNWLDKFRKPKLYSPKKYIIY